MGCIKETKKGKYYIKYDEIQIKKEEGKTVINYYYNNEHVFFSNMNFNFEKGDTLVLPLHFGKIPFKFEFPMHKAYHNGD